VISRRTFLAGSAAAALLTACGGDDGGGSTSPGSSSDETIAPLVPDHLGAAFADGYSTDISAVVAGIPQRAPFVALTDVGEAVRGEPAPASIDVEVTHNGATVTSLTIPRHSEGIPTPYYPLVFTPPEPGDYEIRSNLGGPATAFMVSTRDQLSILQLGDKMRPVDTPTTTNARGVDPVCTRSEPCPFHAMTLTEALASGKPVAFMISTPGFCQSAICGPVLELLVGRVGLPASPSCMPRSTSRPRAATSPRRPRPSPPTASRGSPPSTSPMPPARSPGGSTSSGTKPSSTPPSPPWRDNTAGRAAAWEPIS
jgi:hypothetical protein